VEDVSSGDRQSILLRLGAALVALALIGCIALACVGLVAWLGPTLAHGNDNEHAAGVITAIGPGDTFVLSTASGKRLSFSCAAQCRASWGHLQRHLREHAHTDVYYVQGPDKLLMALDVD
jgi:hypothetical protein